MCYVDNKSASLVLLCFSYFMYERYACRHTKNNILGKYLVTLLLNGKDTNTFSEKPKIKAN